MGDPEFGTKPHAVRAVFNVMGFAEGYLLHEMALQWAILPVKT